MIGRGVWQYDQVAKGRVEGIFHLYDKDGSGELELNEYYILDHIIHGFDEKGLARLAQKLGAQESWDHQEEHERVRWSGLAACTCEQSTLREVKESQRAKPKRRRGSEEAARISDESSECVVV